MRLTGDSICFWFCRVFIGGTTINSSVRIRKLVLRLHLIFYHKPAVNTVLSKYHDVSLKKKTNFKDDRIAGNAIAKVNCNIV